MRYDRLFLKKYHFIEKFVVVGCDGRGFPTLRWEGRRKETASVCKDVKVLEKTLLEGQDVVVKSRSHTYDVRFGCCCKRGYIQFFKVIRDGVDLGSFSSMWKDVLDARDAADDI